MAKWSPLESHLDAALPTLVLGTPVDMGAGGLLQLAFHPEVCHLLLLSEGQQCPVREERF